MDEIERVAHDNVTKLFFGTFTDELRSVARGVEVCSLRNEFQEILSTFRFWPVSERPIKAKHKDIKNHISGTHVNAGPVIAGLAVRVSSWKSQLQADPVRQLPTLFNLQYHPLVLELQRKPPREQQTSAWVAALSHILYGCDIHSIAALDATEAGVRHQHQSAWKRKRTRALEALRLGHVVAGVTGDEVFARAIADHFKELHQDDHFYSLPSSVRGLHDLTEHLLSEPAAEVLCLEVLSTSEFRRCKLLAATSSGLDI